MGPEDNLDSKSEVLLKASGLFTDGAFDKEESVDEILAPAEENNKKLIEKYTDEGKNDKIDTMSVERRDNMPNNAESESINRDRSLMVSMANADPNIRVEGGTNALKKARDRWLERIDEYSKMPEDEWNSELSRYEARKESIDLIKNAKDAGVDDPSERLQFITDQLFNKADQAMQKKDETAARVYQDMALGLIMKDLKLLRLGTELCVEDKLKEEIEKNGDILAITDEMHLDLLTDEQKEQMEIPEDTADSEDGNASPIDNDRAGERDGSEVVKADFDRRKAISDILFNSQAKNEKEYEQEREELYELSDRELQEKLDAIEKITPIDNSGTDGTTPIVDTAPQTPEGGDELVEKFLSDIEISEEEDSSISIQVAGLLLKLEKMKAEDIDSISRITLEMQVNNMLIQTDPIAKVAGEIKQRLTDLVNSDSNKNFSDLQKKMSDIYNHLYEIRYNTEDKNMPIDYLKYLAVSQEIQLLKFEHKAIVEGKSIEDFEEYARFEKTFIKRFGIRHSDNTLNLIKVSALQEKEIKSNEENQKRAQEVYLNSFEPAINAGFINQDRLLKLRDKGRENHTELESKLLSLAIRYDRVSREEWEGIFKEVKEWELNNVAFGNLSKEEELIQMDFIEDFKAGIEGALDKMDDTPDIKTKVDTGKGVDGDKILTPEEKLFYEAQQKDRERREAENLAKKLERQRKAREDYEDFLKAAENFTKDSYPKIQIGQRNNLPDYYRGNTEFEIEGMLPVEQEEHRLQIELLNLAHARSGAESLDQLRNIELYKGLKPKELDLIEDIPGMRDIRRRYIEIVESDVTIGSTGKKWSEIGASEDELKSVRIELRNEIVDKISETVRNRYPGLEENDPDKFKQKVDDYALLADTAAFNFLYVTGYFDENVSKWEEKSGRITRIAKSNNKSIAVNASLVSEIRPVDRLVDQALKDADFSKNNEKVLRLAHDWFRKEAKSLGVEMKDIRENVEEIVVLPNEKSSSGKFWKIERSKIVDGVQKYRVFVYSPYASPVMEIGFLKGIKPDPNAEETLLDKARRGEKLDWNSIPDKNLYRIIDRAKKLHEYHEYMRGSKRIPIETRGGSVGAAGVPEWFDDAEAKLGNVSKVDKQSIQGLIYASSTIKIETNGWFASRAPKLNPAIKTLIEVRLKSSGRLQGLVGRSEPLFYDWDKEGFHL